MGRVRVGVSDRVSQIGIKNETEIKSVTQKVRMKEVKTDTVKEKEKE